MDTRRFAPMESLYDPRRRLDRIEEGRRIAKIEESLANLESRVQGLDELQNNAKKEVAALVNDFKNFLKKSKEVFEKESKYFVGHTELQARFEKLLGKSEELGKKYESEIPALKVLAEDLREKFAALTGTAGGLSERYEAEVPKLKIMAEDLKEKLTESTEKFGRLENLWSEEMSKLRQEFDGIKEQLKGISATLGILESSVERLKLQDSFIEKKSAEAMTEVESRLKKQIAEVDYAGLSARISSADSEIKTLRGEIEQKIKRQAKYAGKVKKESRKDLSEVRSKLSDIEQSLGKVSGASIKALMEEIKDEIMYELEDVLKERLKSIDTAGGQQEQKKRLE